MLREWVSPGVRFELRRAAAALRLHAKRSRLWRWEVTRLSRQGEDPAGDFFYVGMREHRGLAALLLGAGEHGARATLGAALARRAALVSEAPLAGALRVPWSVHAVVPLGRPLDELLGAYDPELRRRLRKQRAEYRTERIVDDAAIERINREMLEAYALSRHGPGAALVDLDVVRKTARVSGRLDLLLKGDQPVGCHLGYRSERRGVSHWTTLRFGYPEQVFRDGKLLRDVNSINTFLALVWAHENGFDAYDMGSCVARPDDGLLQWKRRRGGAIDVLPSEGFFHLRLPAVGAARLFWDSPLFAVDRGELTLRLGLPEGPTDGEAAKRYRELGYAGVRRVVLHAARPPGEELLKALAAPYRGGAAAPTIETRGG